ncbi:MAG TPA: hypothetical protein VFG42_00090 [Baekduia sp.]|uniref:hypothetical protein n=1 Tax=Baekduia sp. TaxID=2600305 RepID=UPI002D774990|nr:hypothetical protein [Baekduia sp.]HET6505159.1 hypothetical protein [Baekduia sp.]
MTDVLVDEPEPDRRRRARGWRTLWAMSASEVAVLVLAGLVVGGGSVALMMGIIGVLCALMGAWLFHSWARV